MADRKTGVTRMTALQTMPADKYGQDDSTHFALRALGSNRVEEIARQLTISEEAVKVAIGANTAGWLRASTDLIRQKPEMLGELRRIHSQTYRAYEAPLHIVDVTVNAPVLSNRPFSLLIRYQNASRVGAVLASVQVRWAGIPFVVEQKVDYEGTIELRFDEEHTLPVGRSEFEVTLFREDGAMSSFTRSIYVLPSNPLSLAIDPIGARVTGTWSLRGDYRPESDTFLTECEITLANGDTRAVEMHRQTGWEFWDGGVGTGTLIESGTIDWGGPVSAPGSGVWRGSIAFSSPRGSGIFNTFDRKEDLALAITMTATDGRQAQGRITARVMLSFGVNIIKVGNFGSQEHVDLYDAVDRMRQIFEQRDITLRAVNHRIINNDLAGGYTVLDSEDEARDMWEDWSCSNDSVDVYVVQSFNWGGFNGFAGATPGPAAKGGRSDGVAVEKTGYSDASGTNRLDVRVLAELIGHELGHYLGCEHLSETGNLMHPDTGSRGPALLYDQYRKMFPHGYMYYD